MLLVVVDLVPEAAGFCLTTPCSDLISEGFVASLFTDVETDLLEAEGEVVPTACLLLISLLPETYPSLLEDAVVEGIISLL